MDCVALLTLVSMSSPDIFTSAITRKVAQSALLKLNLGRREVEATSRAQEMQIGRWSLPCESSLTSQEKSCNIFAEVNDRSMAVAIPV